MFSTGNDIIALDTINKQRSNDSRFYKKILSVSEQLLYQQIPSADFPFENYLWLCWSVKESAYKYLKRLHPALVFSPTKMIVQHIDLPADKNLMGWNFEEEHIAAKDCYTGYLVFEGVTLYFRSKIDSELITTVVSEDEIFKNVSWGVKAIDQTDPVHQSKAVRSFLLNRLHTSLPEKNLRVDKHTTGYPIVLLENTELQLPVSFAHHGRFIAYSFLLQ
jgi:phosphopantetheinyl transferase (holo-ACP synthase)